ncbi:MAG: hypothetical protein ACLGGV_06020 [Bacteroidia bacterium]
MENDNRYKSITELTSELNKLAQKIDAGQLVYEELEDACSQASQLYERLIIIKYKAAERLIKGDDIETMKSRFKINLKRTNQLSLEEVISDTVKENLEKAQTSLLPEIEKQEVPDKIGVEEKKQEERSSKNQQVNRTSLNENFSGQKKTLGDKLNKLPIKNLKTEIGINLKFLFINDLFKGENVPYNEALDKLDSFQHFEEAKSYLEPIKQKMNWDEENPSVIAFFELVERRYL